MLKLEKLIGRYKTLKTPRKVGLGLFLVFFLFGQITSILCAIGVANFSQVLSQINIPSGHVYLDLDIYSPDTMTVQVPYAINNPGIYGLTQIKISIGLRVNYINESNHLNITSYVYSKISSLRNCKAFGSLDGVIDGEFSDFFITPLVEFHSNADEFEPVAYLLDIQFSAKYFLDLITFQFTEFNLTI